MQTINIIFPLTNNWLKYNSNYYGNFCWPCAARSLGTLLSKLFWRTWLAPLFVSGWLPTSLLFVDSWICFGFDVIVHCYFGLLVSLVDGYFLCVCHFPRCLSVVQGFISAPTTCRLWRGAQSLWYELAAYSIYFYLFIYGLVIALFHFIGWLVVD